MEGTLTDSLACAPSVGSVVKKIMEINPELGTKAVIEIVKQSIRLQRNEGSPLELTEFGSFETIDVDQALQLAKKTLQEY